MMDYLTIFVLLYITLCLATSILIKRSCEFERVQKGMQLMIVWLLPYVGAIIIILVYNGIRQPIKANKSNKNSSLNNTSFGDSSGD